MDRRRFLASAAATAIAPSCLAQPATDFYAGALVTDHLGGRWCFRPRVYAAGIYGELVQWSDQEDHNDWSPA